MQIPLNMFHWYIGIPVVFFFAVRGLMSAHKTKNRITLYMGISGLLFTLCLSLYGLPPLFTTDSQILTITTILGDVLQFLALWVMWMAVARIYAPSRPWLRRLIVGLDFLLVLVGVWFSLRENLTTPVTLIQQANGAWQINFGISLGYEIVTALQFMSLIFVAAKFWSQARGVSDSSQMWRLRSIALGFFIIGASYLIRPLTNSGTYNVTLSAMIAVGIVISGLFVFATMFLNKKTVQR